MNKAIDQSGRELRITKNRGPLPKFEIGCDDDALLFVTIGDHIEQELGAYLVNGT